MDDNEKNSIRLSDRILSALQLAVEQKDVKISETLVAAIDLAMTRKTGGGEFVERRDYPPEMERVMSEYRKLQEESL